MEMTFPLLTSSMRTSAIFAVFFVLYLITCHSVMSMSLTNSGVNCNSHNSNPCDLFPDLCAAGEGLCVVKAPCEYQCICPPDGRVRRDCSSKVTFEPGTEVSSLLVFPTDIFVDHETRPHSFITTTRNREASTHDFVTTTLNRETRSQDFVRSTPNHERVLQDFVKSTPNHERILQDFVRSTSNRETRLHDLIKTTPTIKADHITTSQKLATEIHKTKSILNKSFPILAISKRPVSVTTRTTKAEIESLGQDKRISSLPSDTPLHMP